MLKLSLHNTSKQPDSDTVYLRFYQYLLTFLSLVGKLHFLSILVRCCVGVCVSCLIDASFAWPLGFPRRSPLWSYIVWSEGGEGGQLCWWLLSGTELWWGVFRQRGLSRWRTVTDFTTLREDSLVPVFKINVKNIV